MYEFRLLGPLEALIDGIPVNLAAAKPRALLALLLLHRNRVVPTEKLIDELWGDEPPARATKTLQVYVSQLRKELGPERLLTRAPGYELRVAKDELDVDRFEKLAAEARERLAAGDAAGAVEGMRRALDLWRGRALVEFREPFAERAAARFEDLRLAAVEDWLLAALQAGEAAGIVPELEELVASHPLRERPRELLMLALYRAGRQADALELFRRTRELFVSELGIEPSASLRELEQAMLRQDPALLREVRAPRAASTSTVHTRPRRRRGLWLVVGVAALAAAGIVAALLLHDGGSNIRATATADLQVRSFVYKLENFLVQSHDGRAQVTRAIAGAFDCSLTPDVAAAQLDQVQRNRQSLLEQVAALNVPSSEGALQASNLFQKATHASIQADWIYRDWLRTRTACPRGGHPPAAARAADARATAMKQRFLVVFDPLAKSFDRRVWNANEF